MNAKKLSMTFLLFIVFSWSLPDSSDARRMGGGKSFGSRPQYQKSTPNSSFNRQDTAPSPQGGTFNQSGRRPGLFGGMGGMLGGMLMGGFIGSLLFGGGFTGPGLLDLLLVAGGLMFLIKVFRARKTGTQTVPPVFERSGTPPQLDSFSSFDSPPKKNLPSDFNETEFLEGARTAYVRLLASWDKRDLEDIRQFTTPEVLEELRQQAEIDPTPGKTSIVYVNASVTKVEQIGEDIVASVLFDALLREEDDQRQPHPVREVWHFSRKASDADSFWRLEGIQQVER
jgi:predicted lipid-binding transport protein (Tim44 family)